MKQIIRTILEQFSVNEILQKIEQKKEQKELPLGMFDLGNENLLDIFSIEDLVILYELKSKQDEKLKIGSKNKFSITIDHQSQYYR